MLEPKLPGEDDPQGTTTPLKDQTKPANQQPGSEQGSDVPTEETPSKE